MKKNQTLGFFILCSMICFSCVKKEQKVSDSGQVIKLLNNSQSEQALDEVNALLKNDPHNEELLYLKASALSMSAGVDVYKLFPILKVKIFDVAMSQWSDHREFEKKMNSRRTMGKDEEVKEDSKEGRVYKELNPESIKFKIKDFYVQKSYESNKENIFHLWIYFETSANVKDRDFGYVYIEFDKVKDQIYDLFEFKENPNYSRSLKPEYTFNHPLLRNLIIASVEKQHRDDWFDREKKRKKNETDLKMLQGLWSVLDMIPLIKKIPKIDVNGFKKLEEAQDILFNLHKKNIYSKNEIFQKSRKQMMMISALKLIARFQVGIDFDKLNDPSDFYCATNDSLPEQLVEARKDIQFILNGIEDPAIREKNKELFNEIEVNLKKRGEEIDGDPDLKAHTIKAFKKSLEKSRFENCNIEPQQEESETEEQTSETDH